MKITKALFKLMVAGMFAAIIAAGCANNGSNGPTGKTGLQGQPGPLASAPVIAGLDPTTASFNTVITVTGENFTTTLSDITVYCDGTPAMVVSATSTQITVTGCGTTGASTPYQASVAVLINKQMSNNINEWIVPSGYISQFPAASLTGPQGEVYDSTTGKLYIADNAGVFAVDNATGWTTKIVPATASCANCTLADPAGITMDNNGNLIVTDSYNNTLVGINPTTGDTWYILGPGNGLLTAPIGVTYSNGDLYVANSGSSTITQINGTTLSAVNLTLSLALPSAPYGITADASGNLYVACQGNNTISKIVVTGTNGAVTNSYVTGITGPYGLSISGTSLLVTRAANPTLYTALLTGGAAGTMCANFSPWETNGNSSIVSDGSGGIFVGDPTNGLIYHVNSACNVNTYAAGFAGASTVLYYNGDFYIPNWYFGNTTYGDAILEIRPDGAMKVFAQVPGGPEAIAVAPSGNFAVAECNNNAIYNVSSTGTVSTLVSGGGLSCPSGVAYDTNGDLYIDNNGNGTISKYSSGVLTASWATGIVGGGYQIAIRNGVIYVSDYGNGTIVTVNIPGGGVAAPYIPSSAGLSGPVAVAFDLFGNLVISDYTNDGIFRVDPQKHITALVSSATSPMLNPYGVAIPPSQLIYTVEENYSTPLAGKMWVIAP